MTWDVLLVLLRNLQKLGIAPQDAVALIYSTLNKRN